MSTASSSSRWGGPRTLTAANDKITLFVAFNYGGRAEIVDAAKRFEGGDEDDFRELLYAPEMHDPDLIIRTSGEKRLSNYLMWQSAYSELVFTDELWPDFDRARLRGGDDGVQRAPPALRGPLMAARPAGPPAASACRAARAGATGPERARRPRRDAPRSELVGRLLVAIPAIAYAIRSSRSASTGSRWASCRSRSSPSASCSTSTPTPSRSAWPASSASPR